MQESKEGIFKDTIDFFYPRNCVACGCVLSRQESDICLDCKASLPKTDFHLIKDNPVSKILWGRIPIEWATAYLYFSKESRVQNILHHIKYFGYTELCNDIGKWFGEDLNQNTILSSDLDFIIPVPLHQKKLKQRGFNQSELLASGIAESMNKKMNSTNLFRNIYSPTQTRKSRYKRWENVKDIFMINNIEEYRNKHVLLVDDVITTGSTIEACCLALMQCDQIKISIASIGYVSF